MGELWQPHYRKAAVVIPARGGSKGLPGKNIRDLCGKPLIAYSIESALKAELVDRVIVSTDSEEIAEVAVKWGAEVPFLRPEDMAEDDSLVGHALEYTYNRLYGEGARSVIRAVMFPTSPFRTSALVDFMIGKALEGYTFVHTAKPIPAPRMGYVNMPENSPAFLDDPGGWHNCVRSYGCLSVVRTQFPLARYIHCLDDQVSLIDIDTIEDFRLAEACIERDMFDFEARDVCGTRKEFRGRGTCC